MEPAAQFFRERLAIDGLVFTSNRAQSGGAIVQIGTSASIANSTFQSNTSNSDGGAILIDALLPGTSVTLTSNLLSGNQATRGGGISARGGNTTATLIIDRNTIVDNTARLQGGGIALLTPNTGLRVSIASSTVSGNTSGSQGGGVVAMGVRDLAIVDTVIANNVADARGARGGGIYLQNSDVSITGSTISGNRATGGGGLYSRMGDLAISFSAFSQNEATSGRGGGIFSDNDRLSIVGSTISGNIQRGGSDSGGGGLWHSPGSNFPTVISDTTIVDNTAQNSGGGLDLRAVYDGQQANVVTLENVTIARNSASRGGGVATGPSTSSVLAGGLVINGGLISENTATANGGGIYSRHNNLSINGTTITGNRAGNGGGIATPIGNSSAAQISIVGATLKENIAGELDEGAAKLGDGGALATRQ